MRGQDGNGGGELGASLSSCPPVENRPTSPVYSKQITGESGKRGQCQNGGPLPRCSVPSRLSLHYRGRWLLLRSNLNNF